MNRILLTLSMSTVLLAACATAPPAKKLSACEREVAATSATPRFWEAAPDPTAPCPEGTTPIEVKAEEPAPPGRMLSCELPGGVRHGPFVARGAEDEVLELGWLVQAERHGQWIRYDGVTGQWVAETITCGRVTERNPTTAPR